MSLAPRNNPDWRPSASIQTLKARAVFLAQIRSFFDSRQVLEVETPLLCRTAGTDPHLIPLSVETHGYLQTSPEFAMKRLLSAGSGSIYQVCKAFRAEEAGRLHNPEFSMLEWYRVGWDHHQLMDEVDDLLAFILGCAKAQRLSYSALFMHYLQIDPLRSSREQLRACVQHYEWSLSLGVADLSVEDCCDLLMTHCIEPHLGFECPMMVYDYPASQAALAQVYKQSDGVEVAARFEVYVQGLELANGYHELSDPRVYQQRALADQAKRQALGLAFIPIDAHLLSALEAGLPECAGVALGLDRLLMLKQGLKSIEQVISFDQSRI